LPFFFYDLSKKPLNTSKQYTQELKNIYLSVDEDDLTIIIKKIY